MLWHIFTPGGDGVDASPTLAAMMGVKPGPHPNLRRLVRIAGRPITHAESGAAQMLCRATGGLLVPHVGLVDVNGNPIWEGKCKLIPLPGDLYLADFRATAQWFVDAKRIQTAGFSLTAPQICANATGMETLKLAGDVGATVQEALDGWRQFMAARGKRPKSWTHYAARIRDPCRFNNWRTVDELNLPGAHRYLTHKRAQGWAGPTYDWSVSCFVSFARYLDTMGPRTGNVFAKLEGTGEKGETGARPFTVDEARALVRLAHIRRFQSPRARGNPGLYFAFLALTGLRANEARHIRWKSVSLESDNPFLETDPSWAKNKRRQRLPINSELADRLRAYRDGLPCTEPEAPVWPVRPNRATFQSLREEAGIAAVTIDGRATPHGLRKSFATWLDAAGNSPGVVSTLTRHAEGMAQERYIRPDWSALRAAVEGLPKILPESLNIPLDTGRGLGNLKPSRSNPAMLPNPDTSREEARPAGSESVTVLGVAGRVSSSDGSTDNRTRNADFATPAKSTSPPEVGNATDGGQNLPGLRAGVHGSSAPDCGGQGSSLLPGVCVPTWAGTLGVGDGADDPGLEQGPAGPGRRPHQHANTPGRSGEAGAVRGVRPDVPAGRPPRGLHAASGRSVALPVVPHEASPQTKDSLTDTDALTGTDALTLPPWATSHGGGFVPSETQGQTGRAPGSAPSGVDSLSPGHEPGIRARIIPSSRGPSGRDGQGIARGERRLRQDVTAGETALASLAEAERIAAENRRAILRGLGVLGAVAAAAAVAVVSVPTPEPVRVADSPSWSVR